MVETAAASTTRGPSLSPLLDEEELGEGEETRRLFFGTDGEAGVIVLLGESDPCSALLPPPRFTPLLTGPTPLPVGLPIPRRPTIHSRSACTPATAAATAVSVVTPPSLSPSLSSSLSSSSPLPLDGRFPLAFAFPFPFPRSARSRSLSLSPHCSSSTLIALRRVQHD